MNSTRNVVEDYLKQCDLIAIPKCDRERLIRYDRYFRNNNKYAVVNGLYELEQMRDEVRDHA